MKVNIKNWNAVAAWRWDLREDDDLCGICRIDFDATCPTCKFPGDDCPIGKMPAHIPLGELHGDSHCLANWLEQESSQKRCPMCRQVFERAPLAVTADTNNVAM